MATREKQSPAKNQASGSATPGDGCVVITGISGNLGRLLAKRLHVTEKIIGIDRRPFPGKPKDIEHYAIELWRKRTEAVFRKHQVKAVFHVGIMHNPRQKTREHHTWNITGTTRLLEYCRRHRVPRVIILSTANVYGPSPDNDAYLTEDAPLMGAALFSEFRDQIEMDMQAQTFFWKNAGVQTIILRPVHVVHAVLKNAPTQYLKMPKLPMVMGFDPMIQIIHAEDIVEAMCCCLRTKARGVFNITGPDAAPLSRIAHYLKREVVRIPAPLLRLALQAGWNWRLIDVPPAEIDFIHHPCMVDGSRARKELGFLPKFSLAQTLDGLM